MVAVAVEAGLLQARWVVLVRLASSLLPTPQSTATSSFSFKNWS
jgi:hypothetical protein